MIIKTGKYIRCTILLTPAAANTSAEYLRTASIQHLVIAYFLLNLEPSAPSLVLSSSLRKRVFKFPRTLSKFKSGYLGSSVRFKDRWSQYYNNLARSWAVRRNELVPITDPAGRESSVQGSYLDCMRGEKEKEIFEEKNQIFAKYYCISRILALTNAT